MWSGIFEYLFISYIFKFELRKPVILKEKIEILLSKHIIIYFQCKAYLQPSATFGQIHRGQILLQSAIIGQINREQFQSGQINRRQILLFQTSVHPFLNWLLSNAVQNRAKFQQEMLRGLNFGTGQILNVFLGQLESQFRDDFCVEPGPVVDLLRHGAAWRIGVFQRELRQVKVDNSSGQATVGEMSSQIFLLQKRQAVQPSIQMFFQFWIHFSNDFNLTFVVRD